MVATVERDRSRRGGGRSGKYPIAQWLEELVANEGAVGKSGKPKWIQLKQGKDFDCTLVSMRNYLHQRIGPMGYSLSVDIDDEAGALFVRIAARRAPKETKTVKEGAKATAKKKVVKKKAKA